MFPSKLQTIRLLNGLRLINMERINGYNKALGLLLADNEGELKNVNLQLLLSNFVRDSIIFSTSLENIVLIEGGKMPYGIKVDQRLYAIIRNLKSMFDSMDTSCILSFCETCENAIQDAYKMVLNEQGLADDPRDTLKNQQAELKKAQELMRNLHKNLKVSKQPAPCTGVVVDLYNPSSFAQPVMKIGG